MTVPGKGGRPRKWRSDADRVRAFRARQRGDEEPPTLDEALDDGDELALAVERSRQLQVELVDALTAVTELDELLRVERRQHAATHRRLERARADLTTLQATIEQRDDDLRDLHSQMQHLRAEVTSLRSQLAVASAMPTPAAPNRAARRAAKRDRRNG